MAAGVDVGDRVGIWAPNCAQWTMTQFAAARIGAILVNINPAYRTHEFAYAINQSGVCLLVSAGEHKTADYRAMVSQSAPDTPTLARPVFIGTADWEALLAQTHPVSDTRRSERER